MRPQTLYKRSWDNSFEKVRFFCLLVFVFVFDAGFPGSLLQPLSSLQGPGTQSKNVSTGSWE